MTNLPERKHPRLKGYDYNLSGGYFVTICIKEKSKLLGQIVGQGILEAPLMKLDEHGVNLQNALEYMNQNNETVTIDKYVIMPNHAHFILFVNNNNSTSENRHPTNATIPKFVSSIKRYTNKIAGANIWQTSYHDHIIRNEADYKRIWEYIDNNLATWIDDIYHI